jgi:two-component system, response regulator RegA
MTLSGSSCGHRPALPGRKLERLLIVEDNDSLRRSLGLVLAMRASEVHTAATVAEATTLVRRWHPQAVVLDFALPDGDGFEVLHACQQLTPMPAVVAISGVAGPYESFRLAQKGVRAYLAKPIEPESLESALEEALEALPDFTPFIRAAVGRLGMEEVEQRVRTTMVSEALGYSRGRRKSAARLLEISRQMLQHILKKNT